MTSRLASGVRVGGLPLHVFPCSLCPTPQGPAEAAGRFREGAACLLAPSKRRGGQATAVSAKWLRWHCLTSRARVELSVCCKNPRLGARTWQCAHSQLRAYRMLAHAQRHRCLPAHTCTRVHANPAPTHVPMWHTRAAGHFHTCPGGVRLVSCRGTVPGPQHRDTAPHPGQVVTSATSSIHGSLGWWRETWGGSNVPWPEASS